MTDPRPELRDDVSAFFGGVAIVVDKIDPPVSREVLIQRLNEMRLKPDFSDTVGRTRDVRVIEGTSESARAAVVLVRDDAVSSFDNEERWIAEVATREWRLVNLALGEASQLANVQSFSPTIAAAFTAQAIVAIVLSLLLLTIYVWVRFGAGRWALAATLPLFHDIVIIVGLLAVSQIVFYQMPGLASTLGILPFKIDLNIVAALLTIAGYSLNDTIIILDRIRENKGKALYATAQQINDSINQTISRTFITSGTTLISTAILYVFGGEAVRGFAFAFNLGVIIGTYSSIAISAPLVWSRKLDVSQTDPRHRSGGSAPAIAPSVPLQTT
ncbi:protein translocase subunit SecF [Leptolyngbya sp. 15MV]|nr:protein translocase subunit SecF [Leptolyngbya sp. 15MV]